MRTVAAAALVLVLGAGLVSNVHAHATRACNPRTCAALIAANCAGMSGRARHECAHMIIDECISGTITCAASPSGAFLE